MRNEKIARLLFLSPHPCQRLDYVWLRDASRVIHAPRMRTADNKKPSRLRRLFGTEGSLEEASKQNYFFFLAAFFFAAFFFVAMS